MESLKEAYFGIEGIPVIIRFKTHSSYRSTYRFYSSIEGIPVIIRFKTLSTKDCPPKFFPCIEGIPVIIRFKTLVGHFVQSNSVLVLKVFQL